MTKREAVGSQGPRMVDVEAPSGANATAVTVQQGPPIPAQQRVLLYSSNEWESFIEEWAHSLKSQYSRVRRFAGPGDMGIDVAGLTDDQGLSGVWDNYQCKHYEKALGPSDASAEVAKILWYSFLGEYSAPRCCYFVAPRGCGLSLSRLLENPSALAEHISGNWDRQCARAITSTRRIELTGDFGNYVMDFDFGRFRQRTLLEVVDDHRSTPYYAVRFGGGLPERPAVCPPPYDAGEEGSRYIQQLFEAYGDHVCSDIVGLDELSGRQDLAEHFHRQREFFYHAEALRNFARDTVPAGTFEELQTEVHAGVLDVEASEHADGYVRMNAVLQSAASLQITSNALISVVKVQDRKGMCHQLANDDRLRWRRS